jgi:hypothetical protein
LSEHQTGVPKIIRQPGKELPTCLIGRAFNSGGPSKDGRDLGMRRQRGDVDGYLVG